jgi:hypothetical protein
VLDCSFAQLRRKQGETRGFGTLRRDYSGYITLIMMTRFDQQGVMLVGFNAKEGVA